jgi:hypothetical protein
MAAQRAAGEALAGTLNAQAKPSAFLPGLPAANAALVALMQNTKSAAATISMVSLMAKSSRGRDIVRADFPAFQYRVPRLRQKSARSLHKFDASHCNNTPPAIARVSIPAQAAYHSNQTQ